MSPEASRTSVRPPPTLAIVAPCFNEEDILPLSLGRLVDKLDQLKARGEVAADSFCLLVDDGSLDETWSIIETASASRSGLEGIKLAANVGHQSALFAGLSAVAAHCDCCISIDADLQDDLDVIDDMVTLYREGQAIVLGVRHSRDPDPWFKRQTANLYYKTARVLGVNLAVNHADFRLLSQQAVQNLLRFKEQNLFLRATPALLSSQIKTLSYARQDRTAGQSKYPFWKMLGLAWAGISSFSIWPLRFITLIGLASVLLSVFLGLGALALWLSGSTVQGWTSLLIVTLFFFSMILLALSIIGEYIAKIYLEVVARPRYFIEKDTR